MGYPEGRNQNIHDEQKGKLIFLFFKSGRNKQQLIGTVEMLTTKGEKREGIVPQGGKRAPEVIRLQEEVGLVRWTKGRG